MAGFRHGVIATRRRNKVQLIIWSTGDGTVTDPGEGTFKEKKGQEIALLAELDDPASETEFLGWFEPDDVDAAIKNYFASTQVGNNASLSTSIVLQEKKTELLAKFSGEDDGDIEYPDESASPPLFQLKTNGPAVRGESVIYWIEVYDRKTGTYTKPEEQYLACTENTGQLFEIKAVDGDMCFSSDEIIATARSNHVVIPELNNGVTFRTVEHFLKWGTPGFGFFSQFYENPLKWTGDIKPLCFLVNHLGTTAILHAFLPVDTNQPLLDCPLKFGASQKKTPNIAIKEMEVDHYRIENPEDAPMFQVPIANRGVYAQRVDLLNNPTEISADTFLSYEIARIELYTTQYDLNLNIGTTHEFDLIFSDKWNPGFDPSAPWSDEPTVLDRMWDWATIKLNIVCGCFYFRHWPKSSSYEVVVAGYNNSDCQDHAGDCPLDVVIPTEINTFPVQVVGSNAFKDLGITSINLADIKRICSYAFENNNLTSLLLSENVTTIEAVAFKNNSIETLELPSSLTNLEGAAFANNSINSLTIPETIGITTIPGACFESNSLTTLIIPDCIEELEMHSFKNNSINNLLLPDTLLIIGDAAFRDNQLEILNLPASVVSIGNSAFEDNLLTTLNIPSGSVLETIGYDAFISNNISTDLDLPASVVSIGNSAFEDNLLTTLNIPSGSVLETIGEFAFLGNNISSPLSFSSSLQFIGEGAFWNNSISALTIGAASGLQTISDRAFDGCNISGSIEFPTTTNNYSIGFRAFCDNNISNVIFNEGLSSIGYAAFASNNLDSTLELPSSVNNIEKHAFTNNLSIDTIIIPSGVDVFWSSTEPTNRLDPWLAFEGDYYDSGRLGGTWVRSSAWNAELEDTEYFWSKT